MGNVREVIEKTYVVPVSMMPMMTSLEALLVSLSDRRPDSEFKKSHDRVVCSSRIRSGKTDMTSLWPVNATIEYHMKRQWIINLGIITRGQGHTLVMIRACTSTSLKWAGGVVLPAWIFFLFRSCNVWCWIAYQNHGFWYNWDRTSAGLLFF
jgi:hypothetical protein